jgi:hypothetical protein
MQSVWLLAMAASMVVGQKLFVALVIRVFSEWTFKRLMPLNQTGSPDFHPTTKTKKPSIRKAFFARCD